MSDFNLAMKTVLMHEGGFSNAPEDSGGPTRYGITQADYTAYLKRPATIADVQNMPLADAMAIYKSKYWDQMQLDAITNATIATVIMDQGVLRGTGTIIKTVQNALKFPPLECDGLIGPQTIAAINNFPDSKLLATNILFLCQAAYIQICVNKPNQLAFLMGWVNRTQDLLRLALS